MKKHLLSLAVMLMSLSVSAQWIEGPVTKDPAASETTLVTPKPDRHYKYFRLNKPDHSVVREGQASVKHRIDSTIAGVVGSPGYSITYDYTGVGNPSSETTYYPGSNTYFRRDYVYDPNGLTLEWISLSYDSITSTWTNSGKREYFYTATGQTDYWVSAVWDAPNTQWRNYLKWDYTYDANDNVILLDEYLWNTSTNQWVIDKSTATTFNAQNFPTLETRSTSNGSGGLTLSTKLEYYYNQGPPVFPDSVLEYYYNGVTSSWELQYKTNYVLTNASTGDYYTIFGQFQGAGNWVPTSKEELYWDGSGNLIELISSAPTGNPWTYSTRFTWTFINTNLLPDLYVTNFYQYSCMIINQTYYFWVNNQWSLNDSTYYYWSGVTTGLEEQPGLSVAAYPNPAHNSLVVTSPSPNPSQLYVTDLTGRLIEEMIFEGSVQLDVSGLNSGIYIWKVVQDKESVTGKFVKD